MMMALLVLHDCVADLGGEAKLHKDMVEMLKNDILEKVHNTSMFSLNDKVL